MYRRIALLLIAGLLTFGCAATQPKGKLEMDVEVYAEKLGNYSLEESCDMRSEDFESFISRIILLGDLVTHPEHGRIRTHYTGVSISKKDGKVFNLSVSIGKKLDSLGIITIAVDLDTNERAEWFDVDEDGIPELVDRGLGGGREMVKAMDVDVYCNVVWILMQKEIYYPPPEETK
jgi:hypothetical protein